MAGPVHDAPLPAATEGRDAPAAQPRPRTGYLWALLLARIYESQAQGGVCLARPWMQVFPLFCFRCGEPMRIIAFVTAMDSIQRI